MRPRTRRVSRRNNTKCFSRFVASKTANWQPSGKLAKKLAIKHHSAVETHRPPGKARIRAAFSRPKRTAARSEFFSSPRRKKRSPPSLRNVSANCARVAPALAGAIQTLLKRDRVSHANLSKVTIASVIAPEKMESAINRSSPWNVFTPRQWEAFVRDREEAGFPLTDPPDRSFSSAWLWSLSLSITERFGARLYPAHGAAWRRVFSYQFAGERTRAALVLGIRCREAPEIFERADSHAQRARNWYEKRVSMPAPCAGYNRAPNRSVMTMKATTAKPTRAPIRRVSKRKTCSSRSRTKASH